MFILKSDSTKMSVETYWSLINMLIERLESFDEDDVIQIFDELDLEDILQM